MKEKRSKTWIIVLIGILVLCGSIFAVYSMNAAKQNEKESAQETAEKTAEVSIFETPEKEWSREKGMDRITIVHKDEDVLRIKAENIRIFKLESLYENEKKSMSAFSKSTKSPNTYNVRRYTTFVLNDIEKKTTFLVEVTKSKGLDSGEIIYSGPKSEQYWTDNPEDEDYQDVIVRGNGSSYSEYVTEILQRENMKQVQ